MSILRCRTATPRDDAVLAAWLVEHCGVRSFAGLASVLHKLLSLERVKSILIEEFSDVSQSWITRGAGISAFLAPAILDNFLRSPSPWLFASLLEMSTTGSTNAFLGPQQIAEGNSSAGLDLIVQYMQGGWDFTSSLWREVGEIGHQAYIDHHRGYRVNRVVQEDWVRDPDIYLVAGYRPWASYSLSERGSTNSRPQLGAMRTLYYASALETRALPPGTTVSYILEYRSPVCSFTAAEQRLLTRAASGATDEEVACDLAISPNTVKQTWTRIYDRVQQTVPIIFGQTVVDVAGKRGPEKRRRVLAYVRDNPQELRPHKL